MWIVSPSSNGLRLHDRGRQAVRVLVTMALLVPIACAPGPDSRSGEVSRVPVVAVSILPLAGIVDQLVPPDAVTIELLVPPGTTPHSFEPGIAQLTVIEGADLVVELGHPAFPWESTWLDGLLAGSGTVRVRLAEVCTFEEDDPHVWLDPDCLRNMVRRTATAAGEVLPERRSQIESRRLAYEEAIDSVDRWVDRTLADAGTRSFLVQHPAWGYYARAYGLEQHAILSHGSGDRGSVRLARVIDAAKREGISTVIVQPQVAQDAARMVAGEIGATVREVDPLLRNPLESLEAMTATLLMDGGD